MIVVKGTFAVPVMFRLRKRLLARVKKMSITKTIKLTKRIYPVSTHQTTCAVRCAAPVKRTWPPEQCHRITGISLIWEEYIVRRVQ